MEMNCTVDIVCYLTTYTLIDKQIGAIKYTGVVRILDSYTEYNSYTRILNTNYLNMFSNW